MHNPVRFIDPSGLFIQEAFDRFRSAVVDRFGAPAHAPISVTREGNNVSITAHVNITGSGADTKIGDTGITFRQAYVQGMREHWGGTFWHGSSSYVNVDVTIIELNASTQMLLTQGQSFLRIEIRDGHATNASGMRPTRTSGEWTIMSPGNVINYTRFAELCTVTNGRPLSLADAKWVAAHYLGHAMGINDGQGFGVAGGGFAATQFGDYYSMMVGWGHSVTRLDIELAHRAHRRSEWQVWHNNPLVPIYGIRR